MNAHSFAFLVERRVEPGGHLMDAGDIYSVSSGALTPEQDYWMMMLKYPAV